MSTWKDRANRVLVLFEGSKDDNEDRSWQIMNHVLDEANSDLYISKDFYNVQQTAGGLPDGMSIEKFIAMIAGTVRSQLESSSFSDDLEDADFKIAALSFDDVIRKHISFLNGVVHQIAPGNVHLALWKYILQLRDDDTSIYSCYRDYLVTE